MDNAAIGMFDSGVGGLTVARAVLDQLPGEELLYIGDTAHTPYGPRPISEVRALALGIMDELVDSGVKMLVIACNTASAAVLHDARERYTLGKGVPVVEVIHPAARAAARVTRNGQVGLIATRGTVDAHAYDDALAAVPGVTLTSQACPRFVELVERGVTTGAEVLDVAEDYLAPVKAAGVDTLILGCTHYPLLAGAISYVMGEETTLVTSSDETARDVYRTLAARDLLRPADAPAPHHEFRATGAAQAFERLRRRCLPDIERVTRAGGRPATGSPAPDGPVGATGHRPPLPSLPVPPPGPAAHLGQGAPVAALPGASTPLPVLAAPATASLSGSPDLKDRP